MNLNRILFRRLMDAADDNGSAGTDRGDDFVPTEPVAEGAQAIRNLAEAVDSRSGMHLIQTLTVTTPGFAPIDSDAFESRFMATCCIWPLSARISM